MESHGFFVENGRIAYQLGNSTT